MPTGKQLLLRRANNKAMPSKFKKGSEPFIGEFLEKNQRNFIDFCNLPKRFQVNQAFLMMIIKIIEVRKVKKMATFK